MTLNDIVAEAGAIFATLEECQGELTPELEARLADMVRDFEGKAGAIVYVLDSLKADADAAQALADHYATKARETDNKRDRLRERLAWAMEAAGQKKVPTPHGNLILGESVTVEITGPVPERYMKPPKPADPTPDKNAIKAAIKAGEDIPGAKLITTKHVRVT